MVIRRVFTLGAVIAWILSLGCFDFAGTLNGRCSKNRLCGTGFICMEGVCIEGSEACAGRCGMMGSGSIDCGGCPNGEACDPQNFCRAPCENMDCGTHLGMACGTCAGDEFMCTNNRCRSVCEGRCGPVDGRECGMCPNSTDICLSSSCVPALDCTTPPQIPATAANGRVAHLELDVTLTDHQPLCGGWAILGTNNNQLQFRNIFDTSAPPAATLSFAQRPRAMLLEAQNRTFTAALGPPWRIVHVTLGDGQFQETSLTASPDAQLSLYAQSDQRIAVTVLGDGDPRLVTLQKSPLTVMSDHVIPAAVTRAAPTFQRDYLIATSSVTFLRFRIEPDGSMSQEERGTMPNADFALSPEGTHLAIMSRSGSRDVAAREYRVNNLASIVGQYELDESGWHEPNYSPDGQRFVTLAGHGDRMHVWDRSTRALVQVTGEGSRCGRSPCNMQWLRLAPDGRLLFSVADNRSDLMYVAEY